jgi:uncharacterized protein
MRGLGWMWKISLMALCAEGALGATLSKVLVYDKPGWYVHPDIGVINDHLKKMGADNGFQVEVASDPALVFTAANLAKYQVLVLNNISEMGTSVKTTAQRNALQAWIEGGGGLVGFHGSGVVRDTWPWYIQLLGTDWYYDAAMQEARVFVPDKAKSHPISIGSAADARLSDEWNNFKVNVDTLAGISVVLAVDEASYDPTKKKNQSEGGGVPGFRMADAQTGRVHPISWTRIAGEGRVFYSCIGHDIKVFSHAFTTRHFLRAIQWASGDLDAVTAFGPSSSGKSPSAPTIRGTRIELTGAGSFTLEAWTFTGRRVMAISGSGPSHFDLSGRLQPGVHRIVVRYGKRAYASTLVR